MFIIEQGIQLVAGCSKKFHFMKASILKERMWPCITSQRKLYYIFCCIKQQIQHQKRRFWKQLHIAQLCFSKYDLAQNNFHRQIKYPVDFDDELCQTRKRQIQTCDRCSTINRLFWRLIWNVLYYKSVLSNGNSKKVLKSVFIFIKLFLHTFSKKLAFCYSTTFFESLIPHKRSFLSTVTFHMVNVKRVVL